jgi:hypothetical protein
MNLFHKNLLLFYSLLLVFCFMIPSLACASEPGIKVVLKNHDGTEIISEKEFSFSDINTTMTSTGAPGGILLSFQGPTFDPENLWDPEESKNVDNLKTRIIGVPIKELLENSEIPENSINVTFVADDGFKKTLPAVNIYNPPDVQGEPILAYWYEDAGLLPEESGYRLYFDAPDGVYGNSDMQNSLPDDYYHYFLNSADKTAYPSAKGLSVAKIIQIEIQMSD